MRTSFIPFIYSFIFIFHCLFLYSCSFQEAQGDETQTDHMETTVSAQYSFNVDEADLQNSVGSATTALDLDDVLRENNINPEDYESRAFFEDIYSINTLEEELNPGRYSSIWIMDDNATTSWGFYLNKNLSMEVILRFNEEVFIDGIGIRNGLSTDRRSYNNYGRIKSFLLITKEGRRRIKLVDEPLMQRINFHPVAGDTIILKLDSFYFPEDYIQRLKEVQEHQFQPVEDEAAQETPCLTLEEALKENIIYLSDLVFYNQGEVIDMVNLEDRVRQEFQIANAPNSRILYRLMGKTFYRADSHYSDPGVYHFYNPSTYCFHSGTQRINDPSYDEQGNFRIFRGDDPDTYVLELHYHAKRFNGSYLSIYKGIREVTFKYQNYGLIIIEDNLWCNEYEGRYGINKPPKTEDDEETPLVNRDPNRSPENTDEDFLRNSGNSNQGYYSTTQSVPLFGRGGPNRRDFLRD